MNWSVPVQSAGSTLSDQKEKRLQPVEGQPRPKLAVYVVAVEAVVIVCCCAPPSDQDRNV